MAPFRPCIHSHCLSYQTNNTLAASLHATWQAFLFLLSWKPSITLIRPLLFSSPCGHSLNPNECLGYCVGRYEKWQCGAFYLLRNWRQWRITQTVTLNTNKKYQSSNGNLLGDAEGFGGILGCSHHGMLERLMFEFHPFQLLVASTAVIL